MSAPDTTPKLLTDLRARGELPALDADVATICSLAGDPAAGPLQEIEPEPAASVLIGQDLTELTVSLRQQPDINRVLLTAMEAIYRCVAPTCVLLGFLDAPKRHYEGRLDLGPSAAGPATAFRVATDAEIHPVQRAALGRPFQFSVRRDWPGLFHGKLPLDAALWVPIVVRGNTVGFCLSARDSATPFTDQEVRMRDQHHGVLSFLRKFETPHVELILQAGASRLQPFRRTNPSRAFALCSRSVWIRRLGRVRLPTRRRSARSQQFIRLAHPAI